MIYLITLLGYGDNLITGSILENKYIDSSKLTVVGSQVTQKVWRLLNKPITPDYVIFNEIPAFYALREFGLSAALRDARIFRRWALESVDSNDSVIFEQRSSFRNICLLIGTGCKRIEIYRQKGAYTDRLDAISKDIEKHTWSDGALPRGISQRILINPTARSKIRSLNPGTINTIIEVAKITKSSISIIDMHGDLETFRSKVDNYLCNPSLEEAAAALRQADRYIGPDSFFMHLAYYYRVPQLALFWKSDTYFQPPGLLRQGGIYYFDDILDVSLIKRRLLAFMMGETSDT